MKKRISADYLAKVAVLAALSFVLYTYARFPIFPPPYNVLDFDFSALPALIGGFALGPVAAVLIEIIKVTAKIALDGISFGGIGDLSNFIVSCSFVLPAALIYKYNHTRKGAYIGLAAAAASQVLVGALSNYYIIIPLVAKIPEWGFYMDIRAEFAFLWGSLFNLIKGGSNALLAVLLYKRLSPLLKKSYIHKRAIQKPRVAIQNYTPGEYKDEEAPEALNNEGGGETGEETSAERSEETSGEK
jgi:riboflavin transporter FmnP